MAREKKASSLDHVENWRLWADSCEGSIFFFLSSQSALKWETTLDQVLKSCENKFLTQEALEGKSWPNKTQDKQ